MSTSLHLRDRGVDRGFPSDLRTAARALGVEIVGNAVTARCDVAWAVSCSGRRIYRRVSYPL